MNKLLKTLLFLILCTACSTSSAQENGDNWKQCKEQFKSDKIAYISTQMNFTVEEAQKFWPIYNKYDEIFDNIAEQRRQNFEPKRIKGIENLSEEACQKMLTTQFDLDKKENEARLQFYNDLSKLFSQKTIMQYYHSEYEFRRSVIRNTKPSGGSFGKSFKNN
ncbi:MAG: hypothetical protein MJZ61_07080 [Bacteroidales bacterium]|nr:hypothetical protein [Bacteroidales bacterium]